MNVRKKCVNYVKMKQIEECLEVFLPTSAMKYIDVILVMVPNNSIYIFLSMCVFEFESNITVLCDRKKN